MEDGMGTHPHCSCAPTDFKRAIDLFAINGPLLKRVSLYQLFLCFDAAMPL